MSILLIINMVSDEVVLDIAVMVMTSMMMIVVVIRKIVMMLRLR